MIEIKNLSKTFGDKQILQGIDLTIEEGDIYGLVGVSGAGKSTLLRCINGLETFDSGSVLVNSVNIQNLNRKELRKFRRQIGMIFQHFSLMERKTVYDNVIFPMKSFKHDKREADKRVRELLELVELSDKIHSLPRELSGGQKQRVAIARALLLNPSYLLCDEATSALDPNITKSILALLRKINKELGITIVVVTHQMEVVKQVCNKMGILSSGKLLTQGKVEDIFLKQQDMLSELVGSDLQHTPSNSKTAIEIIQRIGENNDILSGLAIESGTRFEVVWGSLDKYRDNVAGAFTILINNDDLIQVETYLNSRGAEWRVLNNV